MPRGKKDKMKVDALKKEDKHYKEILNEMHSQLFAACAKHNPEFQFRDDILDKFGYDVVKVEQQAMQEMTGKIQDILSRRVDPPHSYEESEQSPLSGEASQFLRHQWASGMDYQPHNPFFFYLSPWLKTLYGGDYEGMMKILKNKTDAEIRQLLCSRETLYNVPAIFHAVIGARNLAVVTPENSGVYNDTVAVLSVEGQWVKILLKLIALGADVSSRDVAGFTPLHHCVQRHGNEVTLKMAEILIQAGAEVDAKCRFGATPLLECTRAIKEDFMELLLEHGANPYIPDTDGCSAHSLTSNFPKIQKIFGRNNKKRLKQKREKLKQEAGGSLRKCSVCFVKGAEVTKCADCNFVYYCGRQCQRQAWPSHRGECRAISQEFKDCIVQLQVAASTSNLSNKFYVRESGDLPTKSSFVVKVQVSLSGRGQQVDEVI